MFHLGDLRVFHRRRLAGAGDLRPEALNQHWVISTCQRQIWVGSATQGTGFSDFAVHSGEEAYEFLLRIGCGLESDLPGETEVFAQFRQAWAKYESSERGSLDPWVQKLFEDIKHVRANFLQSIGNSTYGALVRRVLREREVRGPVVLMGSGQLAQAVEPLLKEFEVRSWSRRAGSEEDLNELLGSAAAVIVAVPLDDERDPARVEVLKARSPLVIHLGGARAKARDWVGLSQFVALDDLIRMQSEQDDLRREAIARASRACGERARLRALGASSGGSISISHGWEDLAAFG